MCKGPYHTPRTTQRIFPFRYWTTWSRSKFCSCSDSSPIAVNSALVSITCPFWRAPSSICWLQLSQPALLLPVALGGAQKLETLPTWYLFAIKMCIEKEAPPKANLVNQFRESDSTSTTWGENKRSNQNAQTYLSYRMLTT